MSIYRSVSNIYGADSFENISKSKILVVGAGGIGCEILKNLAYSGCKSIDLIDLDTIDVSNLNRQFLFRPEHVGQPKALIAGKAAELFNPDIKVNAYHDNIKNPRFNVAYISKFNVVLNALDNIDARRHVNRLCLAANVPLIDSGTTGYLGQVMPIIKGKTACYECFPKPTQKVYPICTIRSTPDKPVHCIVWAKECFKLVFGAASESMLFEDPSSGDTSTYMHLLAFPESHGEAALAGGVDGMMQFGSALVTALYATEIEKRIAMDVYKTAKTVPVLLSADIVASAVLKAKTVITGSTAAPSHGAGWDQRVFSLEDCVVEFLLSLYEVSGKGADSLLGRLSFDKDDLWAMKFVTAASNLRSHIFSIPLMSFHDAKGIAGNIIPAIATTNAIVAGVQVMQALRLISRGTDVALSSSGSDGSTEASQQVLAMCPHTYCLRLPTRKGYFLQPSAAEKPVAACYVCGTSQLTLQIDVHESTLGDVVAKVIKSRLGFNEPSVMVGSSFLYEEGDDCDEDLKENLPLKLDQCPAGGIVDGTLLSIEDFTQKLELQVLVRHVSNEELSRDKESAAASDLFVVEGQDAFDKRQQQAEAAATVAAKLASDGTAGTAAAEEDDCIVMDDIEVTVVRAPESSSSAVGKRSAEKSDEVKVTGEESSAKRQRVD